MAALGTADPSADAPAATELIRRATTAAGASADAVVARRISSVADGDASDALLLDAATGRAVGAVATLTRVAPSAAAASVVLSVCDVAPAGSAPGSARPSVATTATPSGVAVALGLVVWRNGIVVHDGTAAPSPPPPPASTASLAAVDAAAAASAMLSPLSSRHPTAVPEPSDDGDASSEADASDDEPAEAAARGDGRRAGSVALHSGDVVSIAVVARVAAVVAPDGGTVAKVHTAPIIHDAAGAGAASCT